MKKPMTTIAAAAALFAGVAGATAISAPAAQAATVNGSQVKYVFCSDNQFGNDLTYYDRYGKREVLNVTLPTNIGGARHCGEIVANIESGSYVWSAIENYHSPYVYAAIYSIYTPYHLEGSMAVNEPPVATLLSRDESYSSYGGFNYAMA